MSRRTALEQFWNQIEEIGRAPSGGYRRSGWSDADLTLREWFRGTAESLAMTVTQDRAGNLWAWWFPPGWEGDPRDGFVAGSHLDSVPDGGAYDGPLGVVSAFAAVDELKAGGFIPQVPIGVVAFAEEEGSRFGLACLGSRVATGAIAPAQALRLKDGEGLTLAEALTRAGSRPEEFGPLPELADQVGMFVEVHVEQGRYLALQEKPLAVARGIWPHGRWRWTFTGRADHAGTTRIGDRQDPMLPFALAAIAARAESQQLDEAVATFGKLQVSPNAANAIPDSVTAWLDVRAAKEEALSRLVERIQEVTQPAADAERVDLLIEQESRTGTVSFSPHWQSWARSTLLAEGLGDVPSIPTAAGHDAGVLSPIVPTVMLFVRNPTGVSHSPAEHADWADCLTGTRGLVSLMLTWAQNSSQTRGKRGAE